jgi:hypothetical protein
MIQANVRHADSGESTRNVGAAKRFVEGRLAVGQVGFKLSELRQATGLSPIAALEQLKRLKPQVARVSQRQDFFVIADPSQYAMGGPPAAWWLDTYFQGLNQPYYLGLLSAAETYGSAHQAVQVIQVMTDRPMRELNLGRIRVRFYVKARVAETPVRYLSGAHSPLAVSTPEATSLDLLRYAHNIGGINRAAQAIQGMLPAFTKAALRQALENGAELAAIQRLGYILEKLERPAFCSLIESHLPKKLNLTLLEKRRTSSPADDPFPISRRWFVGVNSEFELS